MGGIRLEFELPAPPERVWPLLTDRRQLAAWFTETDFVPELGQRFMIWPGQQMAGVDGPISAVVLTIAPPEKLVMGWQSPLSQTTMTWTLQATRLGSRLRVVEWGHVGGNEVAREQVLARLFDVDLRALVEREAAAVPAGGVAMPVLGQPGPAVGDVALAELTTPPAPAVAAEPAPPRRRRRWPVLVVVLIVLLLLAGLGVYLIWPPDPAGGGGLQPGGRTGLGSSPGPGFITSQPNPDPAVGPGAIAGRGSGPPAVGPISGVTPGPSATQPGGSSSGAPSAALTVRTSEAGSLLRSYLVTVSLTNDGGTSGSWRAVGIVLNGLLKGSVTVQSGDVTYKDINGTYCFTPTTSMMAAVAPQTSSNFIFNVTLNVGLSGALIKSVALDSAPCVPAG